MKTVAELLKESPGPDREYFVRHVLGIDLGELYLHPGRLVPNALVNKIRLMEQRRKKGWPVQYIVGEAWFFGMRLRVTPAVLIPRPETELLVEHALEILKYASSAATVFDVGTGSGAIALAVAHKSIGSTWVAREYAAPIRICALDNSAAALTVARANARAHKTKITFQKSNLLAAATWPRTPLVLIAANLPYLSDRRMKRLPAEVRREPRAALYGGSADGLALYQKFFAQISKHARTNQRIIILAEIDPEQKTKLARLATREFPKSEIVFHHDLHGDIRLAEITLTR